MKLNRREFIKNGGLLAVLSAIPGAIKVGTSAASEHVKEQVVKVVRKTIPLDVDVPKFDARTGVPVVDLWLAVDHPRGNFWSDNGMYLWTMQRDHWNYKLQVQAEHRVVCRTPQLSGVVENIGYEADSLFQ
jgi:hypothetical protein